MRRKATLTVGEGSTIFISLGEPRFIDQRCRTGLKSTLCGERCSDAIIPNLVRLFFYFRLKVDVVLVDAHVQYQIAGGYPFHIGPPCFLLNPGSSLGAGIADPRPGTWAGALTTSATWQLYELTQLTWPLSGDCPLKEGLICGWRGELLSDLYPHVPPHVEVKVHLERY